MSTKNKHSYPDQAISLDIISNKEMMDQMREQLAESTKTIKEYGSLTIGAQVVATIMYEVFKEDL
ncbi:hypothetical protein HK103_007672 [Boothiomyces macroporosus]|uniref:Uncharacterized protein n=1 Tax=Boothiomyces macroporosus TaxID=261099 RepID=A0AAD5UF29_9FUNG|nr:hypothetical protein HK103_007672 [Boothiomyces macroporosus]